MSILATLALADCQPMYEFPSRSWLFPCQLRIADELVSAGILSADTPMRYVHRKHHEHMPVPAEDWTLTSTSRFDGNRTQAFTFSCGCKEEVE